MSQSTLGLTGSSAVFSPCRDYRYTLHRRWGIGDPLVVCMLNPSTADAEHDDPTIRRCIGFARREGAAGLLVVNLMAYCSTDPRALAGVDDPVGPRNHQTLADVCTGAVRVVAAWGAHSSTKLPGAAESIRVVQDAAAGRLYCLRKTKSGAPSHPLYLPKSAPLVPWGTQEGGL